MKGLYSIFIPIILVTIFLTSCNDKDFKKTKNGTKMVRLFSATPLVKIKSYRLTYNPKSNGFIKLELESGAEYVAPSVDGGSFSSINSLLKEPYVLFDTVRKELIIDKTIQN
jgi:hypothetical protein